MLEVRSNSRESSPEGLQTAPGELLACVGFVPLADWVMVLDDD